MKSLLHRLIRLDHLIALKSTGRPTNCAGKIGISERSLYDYLRVLRDMGAPIKFSRERQSYYYTEEGRFNICFREMHGGIETKQAASQELEYA